MSILDIILNNAVTLCLIIGLAVLVFTNKDIDRRSNHYFMVFILIVLFLDIADMVGYYLKQFDTYQPARYISSYFGYILRLSALSLVINIFFRKKRFIVGIWIPIIIVAIIAASTRYTHLMFWFDNSNDFNRGPLGYLPHVISVIYTLTLMVLLIRSYDKIDIREILIVAYIVVSCMLATWVESVTHVKFILPGAMIVSCALYYIVLYIDVINVRNKLKRKELENELKNSRNVLAMSQIRSHFIFNLLNTVSGMCEYDPHKADESLVRISRYLRNNIDVMTEDKFETFDKSLKHLEDYIVLEQLRFGDKIKYEKDIQVTDFMIPPLILQPLVENAIRHGLLQCKKGGTIRIRTEKIDKQIYITITDDGAGFDVNGDIRDGAVGLSNVIFRVENMIKGNLEIRSEINKGTEVIISFPEIKVML